MAGPPASERGRGEERRGLLSSLSDQLATREEAELLGELRLELAPDLKQVPAFPELVGDCRLLRTLRGFEHNVAEAAKAFRSHLEARQRHNLDDVRDRMVKVWGGRLWEMRMEDLPHGELIHRYMPEVHLFDRAKSGNPVSLGWWGRGRPKDFIREVEGWQERFIEHFVHVCEWKSLLLQEASEAQGRLCHFVAIFDLKDWSLLGNADKAWTKFCMEVTGPIGTTYHDVNVRLVAIRANQMAKMAYGMIKPVLPKKVTEKVLILGNNVLGSHELREHLDEPAMAALNDGRAEVRPRRLEGQAVVRPNAAFCLPLEAPAGAVLCWSFGVERGECWPGLGPSGLSFSVARRGAGQPSFLQGFEPRPVEGDMGRGQLTVPEPSAGGWSGDGLELRWENSNLLFASRRLRYAVEVECPPPMVEEPAKASARRLHPLAMLMLSLCILGLSAVLRNL